MAKPASFPAIQCHLGDWTYFNTVMRFGEIASRIRQAKEIHSHQGLHELIQRELSKRVRDIASYIETRHDRFFNAIVVGIYGGSPDWFPVDIEEIDGIRPLNLPAKARESLGILQLSGNEELFAVDGQHRVEGIKEALRSDPGLVDEELVVLFVGHSRTREGTARTRRLFTTLNKYAKPVTPDEVIALDEDDTFAIITRMVVDQYDGLSKTTHEGTRRLELVKTKGPQIPSKDEYSITTIRTLYKLISTLSVPIVDSGMRRRLKRASPPEDEVVSMYYHHVDFWEGLKKYVLPMKEALGSDPANRVAQKYRHPEGGNILFRPVGQESFARALRVLLDRNYPFDYGLQVLGNTELILSKPPWLGVMWDPNRNIMNRTNVELSTSLMLFMVGEAPVRSQFDLKETYQASAGDHAVAMDDLPVLRT